MAGGLLTSDGCESRSMGSSGTTITQTNPTAGPKPAFGRRFWCFYSFEGQKKKIENTVVDMRGIRKIFSPINQDFSWPTPKTYIYAKKHPNKSYYFGTKSPLEKLAVLYIPGYWTFWLSHPAIPPNGQNGRYRKT